MLNFHDSAIVVQLLNVLVLFQNSFHCFLSLTCTVCVRDADVEVVVLTITEETSGSEVKPCFVLEFCCGLYPVLLTTGWSIGSTSTSCRIDFKRMLSVSRIAS